MGRIAKVIAKAPPENLKEFQFSASTVKPGADANLGSQKTSKNSSLAPAQGFKAEVKSEAPAGEQPRVGSLGREGGGRPLSEDPDQIIEASVKSCQACGAEIAESEQQLMARYDKIELPPMAPIVRRVER